MTTGGASIPRLQELSYLEGIVTEVGAGSPFEQLRRALLAQAAQAERDGDTDGTFDEERWAQRRADPGEFVSNVTDGLKELARLELVEPARLPASAASAAAYRDERYTLTPRGREWAEQLQTDRRAAYEALIGMLLAVHPQLRDFLRVVGARLDSECDHLIIPLLRLDATNHPTVPAYLEAFVESATEAAASGKLGWSANGEQIGSHVRAYVQGVHTRRMARLAQRARRDRRRERPEETPPSRVWVADACADALTKLAFTTAGCRIDNVAVECLRRWMRFLGLATFSYYAGAPYAQRLWATARVTGSGPQTTVERRVGPEVRRRALEEVRVVWQERSTGPTAMFMPIWELRGAVCWRLRIADTVFDKAVGELLAGAHPDLGFDLHLSQASARPTPKSTWPLFVPTADGRRRVFNIVAVIPASAGRESA